MGKKTAGKFIHGVRLEDIHALTQKIDRKLKRAGKITIFALHLSGGPDNTLSMYFDGETEKDAAIEAALIQSRFADHFNDMVRENEDNVLVVSFVASRKDEADITLPTDCD